MEAKDNDRYELTVTHPLFPLSQKSCLPPPPVLMKRQNTHIRLDTKTLNARSCKHIFERNAGIHRKCLLNICVYGGARVSVVGSVSV